MRPIPAFAISLTLTLTVGACAATATVAKTPTPAPRAAQFDYSPTGCAAPATMRLTVAIVAPTWQQQSSAHDVRINAPTSRASAASEAQTGFRTALRDDFLELVTCRGLLTRGPFANFDAMVFPDRDGSNLLLEPVIESSISLVDIIRVPRCKGFLAKASCSLDAVAGGSPTAYTTNGTIQLGGRVTLTLREPLTNTRMWTKSIEMPSDRVRFTGEAVFSAVSGTTPDLWADLGVQAVLAPALEKAYAAVLAAADGYLNPRELQLVAAQAAEVRRKASISIPR